MVFGINSTSNAVRKCKIARGEAECYLLPDCIASAINPKYHSGPSYHRLILHPIYITVVFIVVCVGETWSVTRHAAGTVGSKPSA